MFRRLRLPPHTPNTSSPDYDLNTLAVPPCGQYTPEKWAAALERRDSKRFRFLQVALPRSIFGARLIVCPEHRHANSCPIELIILSRELTDLTLLHTQTHELAHGALGHPTTMLLERDVPQLLQTSGKDLLAYLTCRAMTSSSRPQSEKELLSDLQEKMFKQDLEAERLAQQILGREVRFSQWRKNTRLFGEKSFEEVGRMLGLG